MNVTVERPIGELSRRVTEVIRLVVMPGLAALNEGTTLYFTCAHTDMNNFLVARPEVPVHSIDEVCASGQAHPPNTFLPAIARQALITEDGPVNRRKLAARETFQRAMLKACIDSGLDGFVSPTVRIPPPSREDVLDSGSAWLPAVSMPAGFTDAGPLVGVEIIGKPFDEVTLLNIALAFEHGVRARRVTDLSAAAR